MLSRDPREESRLTITGTNPGGLDGRFAPRDLTELSRDEFDPATEPAKLLRIVRKHKGTIVVITFLGALAGLTIQLPRVPLYQATVSVAIEPQNDDFFYNKDVNPSSNLTASYPDIELATQVKVLETRALQNRVIEKLDADSSLKIAPPEDRLGAWRKALHLPSAPAEPRLSLIRQAAASVRIKPVLRTRAVDISVDSPDPKLAAAFANTIAGEYIEQSLETRWQSARRTGEWLTTQLNDMKVKLQKSEEDLQKYAVAVNLVLTNEKDKDSMANDKLRQLQTQLLDAQSDRAAKQARYELAMTTKPDSLGQVLDDPSLRSYDSKLSDLRRELAQLSSTMTPAHYKVQEARAQIDEMQALRKNEQDRIVERIHNDFDEASRREKILSSALSNQSEVVTDQSGKIIHYDILQHEVDSNRQLYESLLQRVKEAGISSALRASNIQVIDAAEAPSSPYLPNLPLGLELGLAGGLLAGVALVTVRDHMNPCIERPGDPGFYLGIPELGAIPSWSLDRRTAAMPQDARRLADFHKGSRAFSLSGRRSFSSFAESFRLLLTSILFMGQRRPMQVLVATSPGPADGKSTIVANLALAYAETGRKVLVIDCDMARPRQHEILSVPNDGGLGRLLNEREPLDARSVMLSIRGSQIPGLSVMPFGDPEGGAAANLLHSKRLPEMIALARESFDVILIDTPPMLMMADSRIVGSFADGVMLVVRARQTLRESAVRAARQLASDGVPVIGAVLNDWNPRLAGYYSAYGYEYAKYYEKSAGA